MARVVDTDDTAVAPGAAGGGDVEMSEILVMMQGAVSRKTEALQRELETLHSRVAGISTQQTEALEEMKQSHASALLTEAVFCHSWQADRTLARRRGIMLAFLAVGQIQGNLESASWSQSMRRS